MIKYPLYIQSSETSMVKNNRYYDTVLSKSLAWVDHSYINLLFFSPDHDYLQVKECILRNKSKFNTLFLIQRYDLEIFQKIGKDIIQKFNYVGCLLSGIHVVKSITPEARLLVVFDKEEYYEGDIEGCISHVVTSEELQRVAPNAKTWLGAEYL